MLHRLFLLPLGLAFAFESIVEQSPQTDPSSEQRHHSHHFDVLILTQHWPYTTCMEWEERKGGCRKIEQARWTVHGLWPTQIGRISPNYCNNSWTFDHSVLQPIKGNLTIYWPDVEIRNKPDSLWSHEWTKHGTCAAQLEELDSELKYFSKGVQLAVENPVTQWIHDAGILPNKKGTEYQLEPVWNAVLKGTGGKRPHIDCEEIEGEIFIREIKVCYDKQFNRVDCDGIVAKGVEYEDSSDRMMGTCMRFPSFLYPSSTVLPHNLGVFLKSSDDQNTTTTTSTTTTTEETTTTSTSTTTEETTITTTTEETTSTSTTSTSTSEAPATTTTTEESTTTQPPPSDKPGLVAGVVCSILALVAVGLAVGYLIWRRGRRSHRGYESL